MTGMQSAKPRAPAVRLKLEAAEHVLAELEQQTATLALEATEGKAGAEKALASHRAKTETAEQQVSELRRALALAERLDREAAANLGASLRREQMADFRQAMSAGDTAMAKVLAAAAEMAKAYGEYSEAALAAGIHTPTGTSVSAMAAGRNGMLGSVFGRCEQLILAELFRLAPQRAAGPGRWILPFAKSPMPFDDDHRKLAPCLDEFRAARAAVVADVENQVKALDDAAMSAAIAGKTAA